jgi:hypothetical protein
MRPRSQAELEHKLVKRWAQVQDGKLNPQQAFGSMDEWIIQLGLRKVFLHPDLKQWMWYDRLHDEWVFAGCGVGEAVLMAIGSRGGVKKLPQPGEVDGWCIYRQAQKFAGPLRIEELRKGLETQQIPNDILVWSTLAADWLPVGDEKAQKIIFSRNASKIRG